MQISSPQRVNFITYNKMYVIVEIQGQQFKAEKTAFCMCTTWVKL